MILSLEKILKLDLKLEHDCSQLELLLVKAGSFTMGHSPDSKLHLSDKSFEMTLEKDFWLGKNLVTQAQWQSVMNDNPSKFKGKNLPIENISWHEAKEFCEKINILYNNLLSNNYKFDLPTEAQWEYSCRASTKTKNYLGNEIEDVLKIAWCSENSDNKTHEVGQKIPNSWGFYDMFGNVLEWCFDMIVDYPKKEAADWIGFDNNEYLGSKGVGSRIIRGGCYLDQSNFDVFDAATRGYLGENDKDSLYGFRLCLAPIKPTEN
jgi:formylglycine-generating enzyme required for sulfatase activity